MFTAPNVALPVFVLPYHWVTGKSISPLRGRSHPSSTWAPWFVMWVKQSKWATKIEYMELSNHIEGEENLNTLPYLIAIRVSALTFFTDPFTNVRKKIHQQHDKNNETISLSSFTLSESYTHICIWLFWNVLQTKINGLMLLNTNWPKTQTALAPQ